MLIENTGIFLYFIIKCDCGGIYIRVEYSASDWRKDVRDFNKVEQLFNRKKQLQEDLEYDQMSLKEYVDPFTGEPVKKNN